MHHHIETIASGSGAQTDTEVIAAPSTGQEIVVYGFYVSSDTALVLSIEHGSTLLHRQYIGANGGSIVGFAGDNQILWRVPEATSLTYTTSAAANLVLEVWYDTRAT